MAAILSVRRRIAQADLRFASHAHEMDAFAGER
jgi:hypothetical protein